MNKWNSKLIFATISFCILIRYNEIGPNSVEVFLQTRYWQGVSFNLILKDDNLKRCYSITRGSDLVHLVQYLTFYVRIANSLKNARSWEKSSVTVNYHRGVDDFYFSWIHGKLIIWRSFLLSKALVRLNYFWMNHLEWQ